MKRTLLATMTLAVTVALTTAAASAASRPTLEVDGMPSGVIAGHSMPYIETRTVGRLKVGYHGRLPAGAKLELLVKRPDQSFRIAPTRVRLSGGHGTVAITEPGLGGPVTYELVLVSGSRRLASSRALTVYWTPPPGGIFVLGEEGGGSAYTSLTVASESCTAPKPSCNGDSSTGESFPFAAQSGTFPIPPGWSVALFYNGTQLCTSKEIEGRCNAQITFPTVETGSTQVVISAEVISPRGAITTANYYVTVYA